MSGPAGRVVVLTGATGSAGTATARALVAAGATVVAVGQSAQRLSMLAERIPGISVAVADLGDTSAVDELANGMRNRYGPVDGLVHLVGGYRGGATFTSNTDTDWDLLSGALIDTLRHITLALHDDLARSPAGRAVIVSARTAQSPTAGSANYAAAKAAAEAWVLALADSLRRAQSGLAGSPVPQTSAAAILVVKGLVDGRMRAESPTRKFPGFTDVDDLAARIVGLWSSDAAALNGARIELDA